jgi:hypothetical protein
MAGVGQIIYGSDYNTVQLSARRVLGDGFLSGGDHGYGVGLSSSLVSPSSQITASQWNNLIYDINRAYKHITGSNYSGYTTSVNGNISYSNLSNASDAIAYADANRLTATELTQTQVYATSYSGGWGAGAQLSSSFSITFASAEYARYFFNAGGTLRIQGTYSYGSASPQNDAWATMMSSFSTSLTRDAWYSIQSISSPPFITYQLTGGQAGTGSAYTNNYIWLTVTSISPSRIVYLVNYQDDHVGTGSPTPGPDYVDGTIGFRIYQNNPNFSSYYPTVAFSSGY